MDNRIRSILQQAGRDPEKEAYDKAMNLVISIANSTAPYICSIVIEEIVNKYNYFKEQNIDSKSYSATIRLTGYSIINREDKYQTKDLIDDYNRSHSDSILTYKDHYIFNSEELKRLLKEYGIECKCYYSSIDAWTSKENLLRLIAEANNSYPDNRKR